ncbi:ROK family protein [Acidisoma cellulosilytica]|uniref:ROK family protein n=1 Tax=Acidisoma cellulosilyticum TaxID=2802395 RepID=A0A963Z1B4_9PROT|nr:ROK family protein [Acidisoma cellulosilyticum]MCB8881023.1 ROK family protein [Acidisoma cellulosilyticum]
MTDQVVLGIDVGGTSFKGAVIDETGRTLIAGSIATEGAQGEDAFAILERFVIGMMAQAAAQGLKPAACGLISPGMDERTGHVMFSSNLSWRDFPIGPRLTASLGLPVLPGHDVRTAGLAEAQLGAAKGFADSAMVMIGTGIAAALVTGGQAISGAAQMACELGHIPVYPGGEACACGQFGCLEAYASAASIARRYRAAGGKQALTAADIAMRLDSDPLAAKIWNEAVQALAISLVTVTLLLDPAVIVIGGGLAEADEVLLAPLRVALQQRLAWRAAPPIVRSELGSRGALLGAAILAFRSLGLANAASGWQSGG